MVDEYQDTNRPQYLLIRRLAEAHRNIAVVGDPDQSIYKWRGADLRNILDFERDFGEAKIVRLEQNYRSTQTILDAASAVISRNRNRKDKRLWTDRKGGAKIISFRGNDELEEADFITRSIKQFRSEDVDATMAILYRTNAQSRAIEDSLMREGIPYKIIGGVRFYERKEIKDALAYLKLIMNPHDDVSLRRVINVPARGIGKGVMDSLQAIDPNALFEDAPPLLAAGLREITSARSLWAKLVYAVEDGKLASRATASLRVFRDLIAGLADVGRKDPVSIAMGKMLDQTGYLKDLRDENTEEANERIENLMELVSAAREYETRDPEPSLGGFVDRLSLLSEVDEEAGTRNANVWMMTMHAAKGLEFPLVVIAGLEEGLFPHSRSSEDEEELEEERRLCYVGMTRAQSQLILTSAAQAPGVRRIPGHQSVAVPRRDSGGAGRADDDDVCLGVSEHVQSRALRVQDEPLRAEGQRRRPRARVGRGLQVRGRRSVGAHLADRHARAPRPVRRRHRGVGRRAQRRPEDHRALQPGGCEEAAGEVREAGTGVEARPLRSG